MTQHDRSLGRCADAAWYDALAAAILAPAPPAPAAAFGGEPRRLDAALRVYRNNVRSAYGRALGDAFPIVKRLVGEAFFAALALEFFAWRRPTSPLVAQYGRELPRFLETFEPTAHLAYLPDVARLECLWLEAYHAADAEPLSAAEALAAAGDDPDNAALVLHPSVRLFRSAHAALSIWRHNRRSDAGPLEVSAHGEYGLIVRPSSTVEVIDLSKAEFSFFAAAAHGERLGGALESAVGSEPDADATGILAKAFEAGAIAGVASGAAPSHSRQ